MGRLLAGAAAAVTAGFLWGSLASPAVAQDTGPPSGNDKIFDIFKRTDFNMFDLRFPGSATRVMFYVLVGLVILFAGALIGLVFYRGPADD